MREDGLTGGACTLTVERPLLWWPRGLGEQPLYTLKVTLLDGEGNVQDRWSRRLGLRTLTVDRHKDPWGESFALSCNGVPFFAMGADYIPRG